MNARNFVNILPFGGRSSSSCSQASGSALAPSTPHSPSWSPFSCHRHSANPSVRNMAWIILPKSSTVCEKDGRTMHWTTFASPSRFLTTTSTSRKLFVHGQRPNTRAQSFLRTLTKDKICGAEKYRSERKALLALGLPATDQTLQDLQDDQLWSKDSSRPARLGDSRKEDPWFWHVGRPSGLTEAENREWDIERKESR
jgi:hypothetical protein